MTRILFVLLTFFLFLHVPAEEKKVKKNTKKNFELKVKNLNKTHYLNMPLRIKVTLKNLSKTVIKDVNLDDLNYHTSVYIQHESEEKPINWEDNTNHGGGLRAKDDNFKKGDEREAILTLAWQTVMPVFDKPGKWTVKATWVNSKGFKAESETITIKVRKPTEDDKKVYEILKKEKGFGALFSSHWETEFTEKEIAQWKKRLIKLKKDYPKSVYVKQLLEAQKTGTADDDEDNDEEEDEKTKVKLKELAKDDKESLDKAVKKYEDAFNSYDVDAFLKSFTKDVDYLDEDKSYIKKNIKEDFDKLPGLKIKPKIKLKILSSGYSKDDKSIFIVTLNRIVTDNDKVLNKYTNEIYEFHKTKESLLISKVSDSDE